MPKENRIARSRPRTIPVEHLDRYDVSEKLNKSKNGLWVSQTALIMALKGS